MYCHTRDPSLPHMNKSPALRNQECSEEASCPTHCNPTWRPFKGRYETVCHEPPPDALPLTHSDNGILILSFPLNRCNTYSKSEKQKGFSRLYNKAILESSEMKTLNAFTASRSEFMRCKGCVRHKHLGSGKRSLFVFILFSIFIFVPF